MLLLSIPLLALATSPILAFPTHFGILQRDADFSQWAAPGPNDVRSPCPALNSLANHGILPRNGRGMTLPILTKGLKDGLNVGADFANAIGGFGMTSSPGFPLSGSFDLNNLNKHGVIEHDASLSRQDRALGDNANFNMTIFQTILDELHGSSTFTPAIGSAGRAKRVQQSAAADAAFTYTPKEAILSLGETALYLSTMGDPTSGIAPANYVEIFFEQQRLPYNEGWRPPTAETNLLTLGGMIGQLIAAEPPNTLLPEGVTITSSTLKAVLSGSELIGLIPCSLPLATDCVRY